MYRFKYFYLHGKEGLGDFLSETPEGLVEVFKDLMKKDEYDNFVNNHPTPQQILKKALIIFKKYLKEEYYKIAIINNKTNEVLDYMQLGKEHLIYRYRFWYKNDNIKLSDARSSSPNNLWFDFEGLMFSEEYDKLFDKNLTTKDILKIAMKVYRNIYKDYSKIEIINDETNEVIDYIDESEVKTNE